MRTSYQSVRSGGWLVVVASAVMIPAFATVAGAQPSAALSTVRAQKIANQTIGSFPVQQNDHFGATFAVGDFNGDGRQELATGVPDDDGPTTAPVTDGGAFIVSQYFPGIGLDPVKLVRQSSGLDAPEAGDKFGGAFFNEAYPRAKQLASCDFNHDGFDDLAVGIPEESVGTTARAGAVQVHYGRAGSFPGFGSEFFSQNTPGIPGDVEVSDAFGEAVACGDFDGDGFADLVIGVWAEDFGSFSPNAGMIEILPGFSGGLASDFAYSIDQDTSGIDGSAEGQDAFGYSLAPGNFDGDAYDDLAIGVVGEDEVGAVQILFGSATGLNGARDLLLYDDDLGGTRETFDDFGEVLVSGDFDGDGFDDLAIGVPKEEAGTSGGNIQSGEVKIAFGSAGGFALARSRRFTQDSLPSAGETSQQGDHFGASLAAGDFNHDGCDDLAIGAPEEGIATADGKDGHVTLLMANCSGGFASGSARGIIAGALGIPGNVNEHNKNFGWTLAAGDFDGDGHDDLAIGAPFENGGGLGDIGAQTILYGSLFSDGFESVNLNFWSSHVP